MRLGEFLPRAVGRLMAIEMQRRDRLRLERLRQIATIDPTALVDPAASITSYANDPSKVVIGACASIQGHILVMPQGGCVTVGAKSLVGPDSRVWSALSISIGSYVMISHGVNIHDNNSHSTSWRERRAEIDIVYPQLSLTDHAFDLRPQPVVIEDDVWVGFGSTILKGVTVGRGAVIGCNTLVTTDVEPFTVVAGNPMRLVRRLDDTY
jgi:acetyltransferase-like isoleucine patch superfamily enzyme